MGILPQDEAEKYLNLLKKALSGKLGKNLIDIISVSYTHLFRQIDRGKYDELVGVKAAPPTPA